MTDLILDHCVHCFNVIIKSLHPDHPLVQTHTPTSALLFMLHADCMGLRKNRHIRCKSRGISIHTYWHLGVNFRQPTRKTTLFMSFSLGSRCHFNKMLLYMCQCKKEKAFYLWLDVCMHICVCVYLHDAPTSPLCNNATVQRDITLSPVCIE